MRSDLWISREINQNMYSKGFYMQMYIGFSLKTHKLHARILCRKYKHCAPIIIIANQAIIYQFVNPKKIVAIHVRKHDLKRLEKYGWLFIKYNKSLSKKNVSNIHALTCVQFTKRVCGIKKINIQTPDALLRYLK